MISRIKSNFNFGKAASAIPKIIDDTRFRIAIDATKGAKERIDRGLKPELKFSTIQLRKERGTGGTKPLFETGELYRSIKATADGTLEMLHYGILHERGYTSKNVPLGYQNKGGSSSWQESKPIFHPTKKISKKVPARPFIFPSEKDLKNSLQEFKKDIKKSFKDIIVSNY